MELIVLILIVWSWWMTRDAAPAKPKVQRWRFTFRSKRTPPLEVEAPTDGLAVRALIKQGVDYMTIARMDPI